MTTEKTTKATLTLDVEIPESWFEHCNSSDVFRNQSGYWMYGIAYHADRGWLCFEHDEQVRCADVVTPRAVTAAWKAGKPLPPKWYRFDREAMRRAFFEGIKRGGLTWQDRSDAFGDDACVQLALLGELRYG